METVKDEEAEGQVGGSFTSEECTPELPSPQPPRGEVGELEGKGGGFVRSGRRRNARCEMATLPDWLAWAVRQRRCCAVTGVGGARGDVACVFCPLASTRWTTHLTARAHDAATQRDRAIARK